MPEKTCAVCGKKVHPHTGTYSNGMLVHKRCVAKAEAVWYRLKRGRYSKTHKYLNK